MTKDQVNNEKKAIRAAFLKIVVNAGVGRAGSQQNFEEKILPQIMRDLAVVCGQKPHPRPSRRSIAGFKVREGQIVGLRVTLRKAKLVDFFERLVRIVLPRVKDFQGIDLANVDQNGNLNIGFKEQFVFPEINPEESLFVFSLGVNCVPRVKNRAQALALYEALGVPLKKNASSVKNHASRKSA